MGSGVWEVVTVWHANNWPAETSAGELGLESVCSSGCQLRAIWSPGDTWQSLETFFHVTMWEPHITDIRGQRSGLLPILLCTGRLPLQRPIWLGCQWCRGGEPLLCSDSRWQFAAKQILISNYSLSLLLGWSPASKSKSFHWLTVAVHFP